MAEASEEAKAGSIRICKKNTDAQRRRRAVEQARTRSAQRGRDPVGLARRERRAQLLRELIGPGEAHQAGALLGAARDRVRVVGGAAERAAVPVVARPREGGAHREVADPGDALPLVRERHDALVTVDGATDGDVFRAFVEHVLCPTLQAGEVVVMDT